MTPGTPETKPPSTRLDAELASYPPGSITVRVLDAMMSVLPSATPLPPYTSIDEAAASVFGGVPPDIVEKARELLLHPRVEQAMFAARSIDTGDTGITIVSGLRSALALFYGGREVRTSALIQQQRTDAALKARALAYLVTRLVPLPPAERIELVLSVPAGRELVTYYGALEIAVPFAAEVEAGKGSFVQSLVREQGSVVPERLLAMIGWQGMADSEEMLAQMVGEFDLEAIGAIPHTRALAEQIRAILPYGSASGDLFDLVAAGADALPCYRYLASRLAVEVSLALAKHLQMPAVPLPTRPGADAPVPVPPPPPIPERLKSTDIARQPVSEPFVDETPAPPSDVAWPTVPLPEINRLRGAYIAELDGHVQWRVFTAEGVYTEGPPDLPEGVDWNRHRAAGNRVATYVRQGDVVRITDPESGVTNEHACSRDATALTLDGRTWRRADWDLTGRTLSGIWANGAGERLDLHADGTAVHGQRSGTYALGVGLVVFHWDSGASETGSLFSDLRPSSRRPAVIWIGGERWGWVGETGR